MGRFRTCPRTCPTQPQRGLTGLYRDVWFYRTRRLEPLENDLITSLNLTKTFLKVVLELPLDVLVMAPRYPTETPTYVLKRAACKEPPRGLLIVVGGGWFWWSCRWLWCPRGGGRSLCVKRCPLPQKAV